MSKVYAGIVVLALWAGATQAGEEAKVAADKLMAESPYSLFSVEHEIKAGYAYMFGADAHFAGEDTSIDEQAASFEYVATMKNNGSPHLRVGAGWDRYSFGVGRGIPIPNTLQSVNLIVGTDFSVGDNWLFRAEFAPGFYSDFAEVTGRDFNVPMQFGFSYLVNDRLQWVAGVQIDPWASWWILGGAGVRWQFADQWVLNLVVPTPRLEFQASDALTLWAGADMRGGTYRVGDKYGEGWDRGNLNGALVEYREVRAGAGFSWEICPSFSLEAEGGYVLGRQFDFHRTNVKIGTDGAPYAAISAEAKF